MVRQRFLVPSFVGSIPTAPAKGLMLKAPKGAFCYNKAMKNDQYKKTRGGWSRMLDVSCASCGAHLCFYQKDGPGTLKRLYVDRMTDLHPSAEGLLCTECDAVIGTRMVYKKEDRLAYRLYVGSVIKKIISELNK